MRLERVNYYQHGGNPLEWRLQGLALGPINLLVGKNASGKSKIINLINNAASLLRGENRGYLSGHFDMMFADGKRMVEYSLGIEDKKVEHEKFSIDGDVLLKRRMGGKGTIYFKKMNRTAAFQAPVHEVAAFARRDSIQHPFFECLHKWAASVYYYPFGTALGKDSMLIVSKGPAAELDEKDVTKVVAIYLKADKAFPGTFKQLVQQDMDAVGYRLTRIEVGTPVSASIAAPLPGKVMGLKVKEKELSGTTDQIDMSQGMFRVLSIIIQINYAQLAKKASCILIDDIGEGLDYDRSCQLIELLMNKAKESDTQLVMATNDRFVMNKVPLEYWTIIQRKRGGCDIFNYANSREAFEAFKYTGLSNFDFFSFDFLHEAENVGK